MNWRRKHTGEVIANNCYNKVPANNKEHFEEVNEDVAPTHCYEDSDDGAGLLTAIVLGEALSEMSTDNSAVAETASDSGTSFDGGSGDGGGAGSDF